MEELKPCPFCGGEAQMLHAVGEWWAICKFCKATTEAHTNKGFAIVAWNARTERTCKCVAEYANSPIDGKTIVLHRCSACHELMRPHMHYCPNCGAKVIEEKGKGNDGE